MNTLADFKRALQTEGVKLETLSLASNVKAGRLWVGMVRFVNKWDTTGVYLKLEQDKDTPERGSFLGYDKAADWEFDGDVARNIKWGYSYKVLLPEKVGA